MQKVRKDENMQNSGIFSGSFERLFAFWQENPSKHRMHRVYAWQYLETTLFQNAVGDNPGGSPVSQASDDFGPVNENCFEFGFLSGVKFDRPAGLIQAPQP